MERDICSRPSGEFGYEGGNTGVLRLAASFLAVLTLGQISIGAASDGSDGAVAAPAVASVAVTNAVAVFEPIEPWIHHKMNSVVRAKLESGFDLAVERVTEIEACSELFTRLGADAIDTLTTGLYLPVASYFHEIAICGRNPTGNWFAADNLCFTVVGATPTWICRNFGRISDEKAAIAVIHEALHHAGLKEWPHDRMAMSSVEITEMVTRACGFK